jgi:ubiquinone/menaquinone biosynthesis C-methylase UbiE
VRSGGHPLFARFYDSWLAGALDTGRIGDIRRELVAQAAGVVLDLGCGTGQNLPHLGAAATRIHLVEPDPHMLRLLRPRVPEHGVVHQAVGEDLPLAGASIDTVLATLTLCTVSNLPRVLAEIRRVLRSGGRVLVLEHVLAQDPRLAGWQARLRAPWRWIGGGCTIDRETAQAMADNGFDTSGLQRVQIPRAWPASEWVTGVASAAG